MKMMLLAPLFISCTTVIESEHIRRCDELCSRRNTYIAAVGKNPFTGKICCECSDGEILYLNENNRG